MSTPREVVGIDREDLNPASAFKPIVRDKLPKLQRRDRGKGRPRHGWKATGLTRCARISKTREKTAVFMYI